MWRVIVEKRGGIASARCVAPACKREHFLHASADPADLRAAEAAADIHLKHLNRTLQEGTS